MDDFTIFMFVMVGIVTFAAVALTVSTLLGLGRKSSGGYRPSDWSNPDLLNNPAETPSGAASAETRSHHHHQHHHHHHGSFDSGVGHNHGHSHHDSGGGSFDSGSHHSGHHHG